MGEEPTLSGYFEDQDTENMVLSGVRYCLSRQSYAVRSCMDYLKAYWPFMTSSLRGSVIREITEYLRTDGIKDRRDREAWEAFVSSHEVIES